MSWASRRRSGYLLGIFGVLAVVVLGVAYVYLKPVPSCENGKRDGTEEGVDCGGACKAICAQNVIPPTIRWSRAFEVKPGVYNVVAYVENSNPDAGAANIPYDFRLLDSSGILVAEKQGTTFLSPGGLSPVFLAGVQTGNRVPVHTDFSFTAAPFWVKAAPTSTSLLVRNKMLSDEDSSPKITATLQNTTLSTFSNIEVVAVIFDAGGNAIAASSTVIPSIAKNGSADLIFTWPAPFTAKAVQIDIIPRIPPR